MLPANSHHLEVIAVVDISLLAGLYLRRRPARGCYGRIESPAHRDWRRAVSDLKHAV
jgi:hypothetical protein